MAESEAIQTVVVEGTIQVAMAAVMVMRKADICFTSGTNAVSSEEVYRHRHGRPAFGQPSFNLECSR